MYRHSTSSCPTMTEEISIDLFPVPIQSPRSSRQNDPLIPRTWPGVSPLSTTALQSILSDNHKRWHIFLNDRQFHKYDLSLILWCLSKLLYKVIQLTSYWLYGALVLINPFLNQPTSGTAKAKKLLLPPLTLSINKTGEILWGMNGNVFIFSIASRKSTKKSNIDIIKHILNFLKQKLE